MKNESYNLNLLKVLACLSVCLAHFLQLKNSFLNLGVLGLNVFFLISGYLILRSLERYSPKSFAIHRFFRIYPSYLVVSAMVFFAKDISDSSILPQLFMVNDIFGKPNMMAVQWSLLVEIKFYIPSPNNSNCFDSFVIIFPFLKLSRSFNLVI
jgi:peptidoglycan/LPS O-acetylase OafA/YrhL